MAPEQFKGKPCPQSDLYSLGCTLFYLLTARDPLPLSCSRASSLAAVPAALDDVVAKLTTLDLAGRYQSAQGAAADLTATQSDNRLQNN
jgi:serine/threonine-protein kinase